TQRLTLSNGTDTNRAGADANRRAIRLPAWGRSLARAPLLGCRLRFGGSPATVGARARTRNPSHAGGSCDGPAGDRQRTVRNVRLHCRQPAAGLDSRWDWRGAVRELAHEAEAG